MRRRLLLSVAVGDLLALLVALAFASAIVFGTPLPWRAILPEGASIWPLVGLLVSGFAVATYGTGKAWIKGPPRPAYGRALAIVAITLATASLGIVVARIYWSRTFLGWALLDWLILMLALRAVIRRRPWREELVVVSGEAELVDRLRHAPHVAVSQVLNPQSTKPPQGLPADSALVLDLRAVLSDRMAQFVSSCNLAGVPVRTLGDVFEEHTGRYALVHLAEGWELSAPLARSAPYEPVKRLLDLAIVLVLAPLALIVGALVWIAVRVESRGPGIFTQTRVGRNGRPFTLYKFRTMSADAEQHGPQFAAPDDERTTRVGRILRKVRLDELPQLWNVFRGDLSLVGPRPEQEAFVEEFAETIPFYAHRHLVRPGLTGWAQVNHGYADGDGTVEKLALDLYYVKHMSVWLDAQILGKTIWTVVSGSGAR